MAWLALRRHKEETPLIKAALLPTYLSSGRKRSSARGGVLASSPSRRIVLRGRDLLVPSWGKPMKWLRIRVRSPPLSGPSIRALSAIRLRLRQPCASHRTMVRYTNPANQCRVIAQIGAIVGREEVSREQGRSGMLVGWSNDHGMIAFDHFSRRGAACIASFHSIGRFVRFAYARCERDHYS